MLLPHHRYLITAEDFNKLLSGSTTAKQFWIAEVQSSLAEAVLMCRLKRAKYRRGAVVNRRHNKIINVPTVLISSLIPPTVSKEKGLKWKKRGKK
eukprot:scaffold11579_cov40-Cyclotella_meneghiniana.AAC.15